MAGRRSKLTPELLQQIAAYARAGAFAWKAAQAVGIGTSTYYRWMEQGEKASSGLYRDFYETVTQAHAQARIAAEMEVRRTDPFKWLRYGPGRDRPGEPGWTDAKEIAVKELTPHFMMRFLDSDGTDITDEG